MEGAAAATKLQEIYLNQGLSPDEARARMTELISQHYQAGLREWNRAEWENSLQQSILGTLPMRDAVEGRLAAATAQS